MTITIFLGHYFQIKAIFYTLLIFSGDVHIINFVKNLQFFLINIQTKTMYTYRTKLFGRVDIW